MLQLLRQIFVPFIRTSIKMDFSDVRQGLAENSILLIDVRNVEEVKSAGRIPGSYNIPRKLLHLIQARAEF